MLVAGIQKDGRPAVGLALSNSQIYWISLTSHSPAMLIAVSRVDSGGCAKAFEHRTRRGRSPVKAGAFEMLHVYHSNSTAQPTA